MGQNGKSLKKKHGQNFEPEKIADKICANKTQNHAKTSKNAKN